MTDTTKQVENGKPSEDHGKKKRDLRTNRMMTDREAERLMRNKETTDAEFERIAYKFAMDTRSILFSKMPVAKRKAYRELE